MTTAIAQPNRVRHNVATLGTGTITLGASPADWFTMAEAGVKDGSRVRYLLREGANVELGLGTYDSTGPVVTRDTVSSSKISGVAGTSKIDLQGAAVFTLILAREDLAINTTPPIRMRALPKNASGLYKHNGTTYTQDNQTTIFWSGEWHHFIVWVEAFTLTYWIGHWVGEDGDIEIFNLGEISGNPFALPAENDSHCVPAIGIDTDGHIHLAANMHSDALRYGRSSTPMDISSIIGSSMTGANEDQVTYPSFLIDPTDGTLFFRWRNGVAGNGNEYLNKYSTGSESWSAVAHPLINGVTATENPYMQHPIFDRNGRLHYAWLWTDSGTFFTSDLSYAYSDDQGATWKKATGAAQTVPITHANCSFILDTASSGSGLINQCGMDVDSQGIPHVFNFLTDVAGVSQIHHFWPEGLGTGGVTWHNDKLTNFSRGLTTGESNTGGEITRPVVFCTPDDRVYCLFHHKYTKRSGCMRAIEVDATKEYPEFSIIDIDFFEAEPVYDTQRLKLQGQLSLLAHPMVNGIPTDQSSNCWENFVPLIITYDLEQFHLVQKGMVKLPKIELAGSVSMSQDSGSLEVTATSFGGTDVKVPLTEELLEEGIIFTRLSVRGFVNDTNPGGGDLEVIVSEDLESGTDTTYGKLNFVDNTRRNLITPWMPVRNIANLAYTTRGLTGYLGVSARMTAASSSGFINAVMLELGVLRLNKIHDFTDLT